MHLFKTITVLFLFFLNNVNAQVSPGGVQNPVAWYITDSLKPTLRSNIFGNSSLIESNLPFSKGSLNYRQALHFNTNSYLPINLANIDLTKLSIFTAYQCANPNIENIIWHLSKNQQAGLVFTTSRMADIIKYRYLNFIDKFPLLPKVNTYIEQNDQDSVVINEQVLYLGKKPTSPSLPINNYNGLIPEIILYNRILTQTELLQVSSYLSLKYGITLSEPDATYLNSQGQKIWEGYDYPQFHHNITGIVRDDSSGLLQLKATSSNQPNLISISANSYMASNCFYIWGDNDLPLIPAETVPAGVPTNMLQKEALMVATTSLDSLVTTLTLDTKKIDAATPVNPTYWLAVDRTGKGDYAQANSEFIKMSAVSKDGFAKFENIKWGKNKTTFGWVIANEILMSVSIKAPTCAALSSGSAHVKAWGATYPCTLQIVKNNQTNTNAAYTISSSDGIVISNLDAGFYSFKIIDANKHSYASSFYINNSDVPHPTNINSVYTLMEPQQIDLDAGEFMPLGITYKWQWPDGHQSYGAKISINQSGIYTLTTGNGLGCEYKQEIKIKRPPKNVFTDIKVFPNPSTGQFFVKLSLDKIANVTMQVFSEDGKLINVREFTDFANYSFTHNIPQAGLYFLVFRSGLSVHTEKIVIIK